MPLLDNADGILLSLRAYWGREVLVEVEEEEEEESLGILVS